MIALSIAVQNLLAARRRTAFLGAALFLVTMLMVLLLSLTGGIRDSIVRAATATSSGHVNIGGFFKPTVTDAAPLVTRVPELRAIVKETLPNARVIDRSRGWGKIISDRGTVQAGLNGIELAEEKQLFEVLSLAPEREYKEDTKTPERVVGDFQALTDDGIIIFAAHAKRLKVEVGDQVTLRTETNRGQSNTADVTVVAIARDLGPLTAWSTFITKEATRKLYQLKPDVSGAVQIYLPEGEAGSKEAMNKVRKALTDKGFALLDHDAQPFYMKMFMTVPNENWTGQKYDVTTWEDESSFLMYVLTGINSISFLLLSLLTFIIAVGIMNTMYIAVRERTREIGTLRAIGMSRRGILGLFVLESLALGLISTALGALFGVAVAVAVDAAHLPINVDAVRMILMSDALHLQLGAGDVVAAVVAFTVIAGASALLPALRAARITPVTAMQAAD